MVTGNTRAKRVSLPLRSKVLRISIIDSLSFEEVEAEAVGIKMKYLSWDKKYFCRACTDPDDNSGFLAVYERENFSYQLRTLLQPYDTEPGDGFGLAVEFSKDSKYLVIGSDTKASFIGAAYVFVNVRDGWVQASKLIPPDGKPSDQFGISVSISDDNATIVVGSPGSNHGYGSVYVHQVNKTEWILDEKLMYQTYHGQVILELGTQVYAGNSGVDGVRAWGLTGKDLDGAQACVVFLKSGRGWRQEGILLAS